MQQKPVGPEIHQTRRNAISVAEDAEAARQAAEASRTQYEQVVSMISDVVWRFEVDGQGQFVNAYISPVADRLLGLPAGTIGNSFDKYFSYVYPEELPALQKLLFSGLRGLAKEATAEYRMRKPDGTTIWVRSKGSAYPQPDGHIVGDGTASDISERKRAEQGLQQFNQELKSAAVQVKGLMTDVVQKNVFTGRFDNPSLTPCWEATKCDNTVCPSYRNYANLRCWEVAGQPFTAWGGRAGKN
jgi:PAS domain S-box-containing protein